MDVYELIEKGKIKRYLSARNRIIYPGAIYHVTHRAPGREIIFVEKSDYLRMLALLKEVSKDFFWDIFSFVLMPNHFHILLKIKEPNLSLGMKKICEKYAKFYNVKYERKGPVFARPYRAALCLGDTYLLAISIYIHLNPFKAGICKNLDSYRWSSLRLYIGESKKSFINPDFVLDSLDTNYKKAREKYLKLVSESLAIKFKNIVEVPSYIDYFENKLKELLKKMNLAKNDMDDEIEELKKKSKFKKPVDILARKYLIEQLLARGFRIKEVVDKLKVSRGTVYYTLNYTK